MKRFKRSLRQWIRIIECTMAKYKINSDSVAHFPIVIGQLFAEGFRQVAQFELNSEMCDRLCWPKQSTRMSPSCTLVDAFPLSPLGKPSVESVAIVRSHSKRPPLNCILRRFYWPIYPDVTTLNITLEGAKARLLQFLPLEIAYCDQLCTFLHCHSCFARTRSMKAHIQRSNTLHSDYIVHNCHWPNISRGQHSPTVQCTVYELPRTSLPFIAELPFFLSPGYSTVSKGLPA